MGVDAFLRPSPIVEISPATEAARGFVQVRNVQLVVGVGIEVNVKGKIRVFC